MARSLMAAPLSISRRRSASTSAVSRRSSFFSSWKRLRLVGLARQVADLLVDLVAQVLQALHVLARVGDAAFGFLAALLVARDARGLLDEGTHVVAARLDDARDHALLDDGVAARAQARAQEQRGDVLAAAARAIDEVGAVAIARDHALQRDLGVAGVGAADLAVAVVEDQLDRGRAHGPAAAGPVEDDVGHRIAAQVARGKLAHHPAHGIDDVGLAAAVRAHDAGEVGRERDIGGVHEGLEPGELYSGQAHQEGEEPQGKIEVA